MKKLGKLVLKDMESKELTQRQMNGVRGGVNTCTCGCCYGNEKGSSSKNNGLANCDSHLVSDCPSPYWAVWGCNV